MSTGKDAGQLYSHKPYMGPPVHMGSVARLYMGDVVRFTYKSELKHVFVLNPQYKKKMHGLSLTMLPREILVKNVIDYMDQTDDPYLMYTNIISKNDISEYDAYRTYLVKGISGIYRFSYTLDKADAADTDLDEKQKARGE